MSLTIRPLIKCPLCGHKQAYMLDIRCTFGNHFFIRCDAEEGGCDELFAVEISVKTIVTTLVMTAKGVSHEQA